MAWYENLSWWVLLDAYIVWIFLIFILKFIFINKRLLEMTFFLIILVAGFFTARHLGLIMSQETLLWFGVIAGLMMIFIAAPTARLVMETLFKESHDKSKLVMGSEHTKNEIIKAVKQLSNTKTGALITIEKYNKLDQYAQRAVILNAEVTAELIQNIFNPNTPLHDGAVIIRGDKILCASAYFVLSSTEQTDKSTGSRHRAGLGISEISDSLTIVVSEQTGVISIAYNATMTKLKDISGLTDFLNMFMKGYQF